MARCVVAVVLKAKEDGYNEDHGMSLKPVVALVKLS